MTFIGVSWPIVMEADSSHAELKPANKDWGAVIVAGAPDISRLQLSISA